MLISKPLYNNVFKVVLLSIRLKFYLLTISLVAIQKKSQNPEFIAIKLGNIFKHSWSDWELTDCKFTNNSSGGEWQREKLLWGSLITVAVINNIDRGLKAIGIGNWYKKKFQMNAVPSGQKLYQQFILGKRWQHINFAHL